MFALYFYVNKWWVLSIKSSVKCSSINYLFIFPFHYNYLLSFQKCFAYGKVAFNTSVHQKSKKKKFRLCLNRKMMFVEASTINISFHAFITKKLFQQMVKQYKNTPLMEKLFIPLFIRNQKPFQLSTSWYNSTSPSTLIIFHWRSFLIIRWIFQNVWESYRQKYSSGRKKFVLFNEAI